MAKNKVKKKGEYHILSILSLVFAFVSPPAGVIFGILALIRIKETGQPGRGLAIAGIIISVIYTLMILLFLLFFFGLAFFGSL